jgi:hypothetical protein
VILRFLDGRSAEDDMMEGEAFGQGDGTTCSCARRKSKRKVRLAIAACSSGNSGPESEFRTLRAPHSSDTAE